MRLDWVLRYAEVVQAYHTYNSSTMVSVSNLTIKEQIEIRDLLQKEMNDLEEGVRVQLARRKEDIARKEDE